MKKLQNQQSSKPMESKNRIAFRGGSYSLILTAVVLAIVIVANVFAAALPTTLTKYDISASKLYSITSNTKAVVNALKQDVTIYWIVQAGEEDKIIENLLSKYDSLSEHIHVVKKNPDVYPTFAEKYTDEKVKNNSLVVESGERFRYISFNDIYVEETTIYYYQSSRSFDGEGAITSAIDYVVSKKLPQLYLLTGHGEPEELPVEFREHIEKDNIEVQTLSLPRVDAVPEDADVVMIYAPTSDISEEEKKMLTDYVKNGGKLLVIAGPTEDGILKNLYSILGDYGIEANEGVVIEGDRDYYAFQTPLLLMPEMASHEITDPLIEENYYPIIPVSLGLTIQKPSRNITGFLETSFSAFSKTAGFDLTTYEKEEGDIDGPFTLAVSIDTDNEGRIVWFASSLFLDDLYNAYSSGANVDMAMNALSALIGEREALAIRSKSLDYNYLTISDSTSSLLKVLMIGVFPLLYLGVGIGVVWYRRRAQHEAN